jgi:tetratricopeptide (TPR) repeat protein
MIFKEIAKKMTDDLRKKICLTMIVGNESHIIKRCLDAAKPIIDYFCICGASSKDNTLDLIQEWSKESGIPGTVYREEFVNFGHTRTISINKAKEHYPDAEFLLFLDADMILRIKSTFDKGHLREDCYKIFQYNHHSNLRYRNVRIVRASLPWKYVGATHEYCDCENEKIAEVDYDELYIDDMDDGGSRGNKTERDIALLTAGLKENPNLERDVFYLAQCYWYDKQYLKAIETYERRTTMGGYYMEVWHSYVMLGRCYDIIKDSNKATVYFLKAILYNGNFAEPYYELARLYRIMEKQKLGYMFAMLGKEISLPVTNFFIDENIYEYLLDFEISICAYYAGMVEEGQKAILKLLEMKDKIPDYKMKFVIQNASFYGIDIAAITKESSQTRRAPKTIESQRETPSSQEYPIIQDLRTDSESAPKPKIEQSPDIPVG